MSVPAFLLSSYYVHHNASVADNDIILDEIMTALTGQSPAWTLVDNRGASPATVLATSPVDGDGRFFDILFTVVAGASNLKMEYRVRDQNAVTVMTKRTGTSATNPWEIWIFSGQYHFNMEICYVSAAPEYMCAGITDFLPEAQTQNSHYVHANASKNTSDASNNPDLSYENMIDNAAAAQTQRAFIGTGTTVVTAIGGNTPAGYKRYVPRELWAKPTGEATNNYWAGRCYQELCVPDDLPTGARIVVPIDIGSTGVFQVSGRTALANKKLAWRVA